MAHDPISSDSQRDHLGTTFSHIQSILIAYRWVLNSIDYAKALDIGCGEGYGAKILGKNGALVLAVDLHLPALQLIDDDHVSRVCSDAFKLGVRGSCLDLVVASHIIEHFDDDEREAFLRETARVVSPEGLVVIATPNPKDGFHYQHGGVHKILYDRDHLYEVLARYFAAVDFYGVYPSATNHTLKGLLRKGKQFLERTGLLNARAMRKSIAKTSVATTTLNFAVQTYKADAHHLIAVCRTPKQRGRKISP